MSTPIDAADRRAALYAIKLAALVRDQTGRDVAGEVAGFGGGAGVTVGDDAWVLLADGPAQGLGAALAWSVRRDAHHVHVIAEQATGVLARRAEMFDLPVDVHHVDGRVLLPAIAEALPAAPPVSDGHGSFTELIRAGGADPVEEHGVLIGEVRGLEVCRVVDDPHSGETRLEVGVGAHDRETFQMLHGDRPTVDALAGVVAAVIGHRSPGASQHPLNLLAASRLVRARLIERPSLIGATKLWAVAPPLPRPNVKDQVPCVAVAALADGTEVLVVCTSGIDLDVVPFATDALRAEGSDRCWIAAPARDIVDIQQRLAAHVRIPTNFVAVDAAG